VPTPFGGNQEMIIISEPGVYRLVFRSRKPEAEEFKRWLAHEVLPQIRRTGGYSDDPKISGFEPVYSPNVDKEAPLAARIDAVRVAKTIFGRDAARALWQQLGLPVPQPSPWEGAGESARILGMIVEHAPDGGQGRSIKQMILDALEGDEEARLILLSCGIRPTEDPDGFYIAQAHPDIRRIFAGTLHADGSWRIPLRRLSGNDKPGLRQSFSTRGPSVKFAHFQSRAIWLPATVLDTASIAA
jgi:BRO family, N-terminal domain